MKHSRNSLIPSESRFVKMMFGVWLLNAAPLALVQAQDLPLLADPAELHLKVIKAEPVTKIEDTTDHHAIIASPGAQVMVVTLEGSIGKPCRVQLESGEFAVAFEFEVGRGPGGSLLKEERVHRSKAVSAGDDRWTAYREDRAEAPC